jgi:transposase
LRGLTVAAIGLEASGGYERGAIRTLLAAGLPACQVNPFKLRQFARASGVLAKNDPLDTRMIASLSPSCRHDRRSRARRRLNG